MFEIRLDFSNEWNRWVRGRTQFSRRTVDTDIFLDQNDSTYRRWYNSGKSEQTMPHTSFCIPVWIGIIDESFALRLLMHNFNASSPLLERCCGSSVLIRCHAIPIRRTRSVHHLYICLSLDPLICRKEKKIELADGWRGSKNIAYLQYKKLN